ncbi:MAG: T9SS type A sorting domain-containing protein [Bacteroidetes bacterium]|nr:T9SS type A sorting domain-containing protein [Bacteroidota bacterium]
MKKYILIIFTILSISMLNNLNAQHVLGRWVLPTIENAYYQSYGTYQLTFNSDGSIEKLQLPETPIFNGDNYCYVSGGAYNNNYDRNFYVIGPQLCYSNTYDPWTNQKLQQEYQIINKPNHVDKYYSFYIEERVTSCNLKYNQINYSSSQATLDSDSHIIGGVRFGYTGFAIGEEIGGEREMFTSTIRTEPGNPYEDAALRHWIITENGVQFIADIITENHTDLSEKHFDAYNLEYIVDNNNDVIAWTHGTYDLYQNWVIVDQIIVVNSGTPKIIDLDLGRIGGIEFSTLEDNMLYISTTDGGIVKINYVTYASTTDIVYVHSVAPYYDYGRTFLQTAPDGHIYGVSNDGNKLGRIYQYDDVQHNITAGTFVPDVFEFNDPIPQSVSTFREFENKNYYILPENSNTWVPLEAEAFPEDVTCPGDTDGSVIIYVSGGAPFEAPNDPYTIECTSDPSIIFSWDDDGYFYANNLGEGTYDYIITDSYDNEFIGSFLIGVDFDDYTYKEHFTFQQEDPFNNVILSFAKGFTIPKGVKITFNNSTILMGPDAKIIIEAGTMENIGDGIPGVNGGELILNSTTLTHHAACNDPWHGIEVRGIKIASQLQYANGLVYQGKLVVENSSLIKNAVLAVTNNNPQNVGSVGGIVLASNSTFENNITSINFMPYQNFNSVAPEIKLPYRCEFISCSFEINDLYLFNQYMAEQIKLDNVAGINFRGCTFSNYNTSWPNRGTGINSFNAGYKLLDYSYAGVDYHCEFNNLYKGINVLNDISSTNTIMVDNAEFINNSIGAYISAVNNVIIINSNFEVGYNYIDTSCGYSMGYGIDIHSSVGFAIEENQFSKFTGGQTGYYTGIRAFECPVYVDFIYNNDFQNLSYGNYAYGTNRANTWNEALGLKYECNTNSQNNVDFIVTDVEPIEAMIHSYHGDNNVRASGNTFSEIIFPEINWSFRQEGYRDINWYYCNETNCPDQFPEHVFRYHPDHFQIDIEQSNDCLSHYGEGGDIKFSSVKRQQIETEYALNLSDYENVKMLYDNLEDGGSTTSELLDIQTAVPDDMWVLRSQLLGDSPHLSEEVLKEVADRTDVFPESAIFDIMAANPDEMKKEELLNYLENKEDPLPDYMISILRDLSTGSTYKTVLVQDMAYYGSERLKAAQDIIRSILSDTIVDKVDYRNWLDNIGIMGSDKQIINSYLSEGDTSNALTLLNMLPGLYELQGDQLDALNDYSYMVNLNIKLKSENRSIYQLDSLEIADLIWLADSSTKEARSYARNILEFAYDDSYCNCLYVSDSNTMKSSDINISGYNQLMICTIEAIPNPAKDWTEFKYQLPHNSVGGKITITDIRGSILEALSVSGNEGVKLWDTRNIPNGVYIITLSTNGYSSTNKMIINH